MRFKRGIKNLLVLSLICGLTSFSKDNFIYADYNLEGEFKSFIKNYNENDVIVDNGISLSIGDTINISGFNNVKLSNNNILKFVNSSELKAVKEGTVYLSKTINNKVVVTEVLVSDEQKLNSLAKSSDRSNVVEKEVNRDYYKVFIDPGHGGSDSGALGFGYRESDINLQVAKKVESKLKDKGIDVKMSRNSDVFYSLAERAEMANEYDADVFVSIHQNSADNASAKGIETYYNRNQIEEKPLSDEIQSDIISETGSTNRGVKDAGFAVLVKSNMPASLVECGFISNENEVKKISNSDYQDKLAEGIVDGIESYLDDNVILESENLNDENIKIGTVTAEALNVRSGYGSDYSKIGSLPKGTKVQILETKNGWHKILFNDRYGYVSGAYVDIDEDNNIQFSDIENHWAKDQIESFVSEGYVTGYEDNTFRPNNYVTRAEFVRMVNNYFGFKSGEGENFKDVDSDKWYYKDVCIGLKQGYINGYEDNTFRPNDPISREEVASIITSINNLSQNGFMKFKDDSKIGAWAKPSVYALADNHIMCGYEDNTFRPKNKITRAESVATLSRVTK